MARQTCPKCGAGLAAEARWCTQCYEKLVEPEPETEAEAGAPVNADTPIAYTLGQVRWSRRIKSDTSFGLAGRIVLTILLVALPILMFLAMPTGPFGLVGLAIWIFVVGPMFLRSIWKKTRIVD